MAWGGGRRGRVVRSQAGGFTLVELLLALGVFAVLSAMAFGGLSRLLQVREVVETRAAQLAELSRGVSLLERDLLQSVARAGLDEIGQELPAMHGDDGLQEFLVLTRTGWQGADDPPRSSLIRVSWSLEDDRLLRREQPLFSSEPLAGRPGEVVLEGVASLGVRFLDGSNQWWPNWPPAGAMPTLGQTSVALPRGVEVTLEVTGQAGPIRRVFQAGGS
ncbi:MAG: type II secretion system minor pseudopilin GspJ [Magnetococcus sp. WYHC-3]